ncbi:hypothetical protein Moror_4101 [Moniliophthora roreri MCA 2997]|uniref:Uncharacterized protein n=1 Tax=Moniliophthora roreri (strain MCA 2997) TaxID=1381753 RepID=V2WV75_MONRO|nr:hypothetical protein Moror_4101 [Moniliophthora roreri MCA 2997]
MASSNSTQPVKKMQLTKLTALAFTLINAPPNHPPVPENPLTGEAFNLTTKSDTDVWRTPPTAGGRDSFNAPFYVTKVPLKSFNRLRVTAHADWKSRYAQGGLVFYYPDTTSPQTPNTTYPAQWLKTGIEFEDNAVFASVVATNPWSDWSLRPWGDPKITLEISRKEDGLWVYVEGEGAGRERAPFRQVTWGFEGQDEGKEVMVGVFTAMPLPLEGTEDGGELTVTFEDLQLDLIEGY